VEVARLRVLTLNLFARHGGWTARAPVLRSGIAALAPDVVLLQEAVVGNGVDTAREVLGPGWHVVHQEVGLVGDRTHRGASVASRWPFRAVAEVDLHLTPRTADYACGAVVAELEAPPAFGRLMVAGHGPSWARWAERERELQAAAVVRRIDELVAGEPAHVVLGGDLNAGPSSAGVRFLAGEQSLDGESTAYRDCWEAVHPGEPGATFDPRNPLTAVDEPGLDGGRRIDYLFVRCGDHGPTLRTGDCRVVLDSADDGIWPSDHFGVLADLTTP
jgi:endonuclease/exonuclease/phosphatase family metal-dependent hydrolase